MENQFKLMKIKELIQLGANIEVYDNNYNTNSLFEMALEAKTEWSKHYIAEETVLYDIEENRYYLLNEYNRYKNPKYQNGIPNDWVGAGCIFPIRTLEVKGERYLFSMIDAYDFLEYVNSNDFKESIPKRPDIKQRFQKIADTLTIEDNPVLLLLKLK